MRSSIYRSAALSALALAAALPTAAREAPVQITVGQPNIWSLEQAHYLLAQMHERSAALKAKLPGEDILDPAGTQGQTFDFLRSAVAADLSFDEVTRVGNRLELETFEHESSRRRQLQAQLDAARARQATLTTEVAQLESRRTAMAAALPAGTTTSPELTTLDATIASRKAEKAAVDGQVTALTSELTTLASDPELASSAPGTTATLPTHGLATFLAGLTLGQPKLHPSVVLDNFVQFQYEIIAKQLSLLRDELEEDERLVFLELPQAVYTVPDKADDYLVRASWRVEEYCELTGAPDDDARRAEGAEDLPYFPHIRPLDLQDLRQHCQPWKSVVAERDAGRQPSSIDRTAAHRPARVLDLIPRTLAVNLDATTASSHAVDLGLDVGTLGGVGLGLALQRQHDLARRLVEQQVFAAGSGRGDNTFGWVFAPPPGSRRVHPGDKTTYAVLAVPKNAGMIRLQAEKCFFHRSLAPGDPFATRSGFLPRWWRHCSNDIYFDLRVPGHSQDLYYVDRVSYSGVAPGERALVFVSGRKFSPQTGVLVNGTPLQRSLSIAKEAAALAAGPHPSGYYEIVDSGSIVMSFSMPAGYTGTPLISLVSPGKAAPINFWQMEINNDRQTTLASYSKHHPMFRPEPRIAAVRPVTPPLIVEVLGSGFRDGSSVSWYLNSEKIQKTTFHTSSQVRLEVPAAAATAPEWRLRYVDGSTQRHEETPLTVPNPFRPRVTDLQVTGIDQNPQGKVDGYEVLFTTHGFTPTWIRPVDAAAHVPVQGRGNGRYFAAIAADELPTVLEVCAASTGPSDCHLFTLPRASAPPPQVHVVRPASVAVGTRGSTVRLRGAHFGTVKEVSFGTVAATILERKGATEILVQVPESSTPGPVRIRLVGDDNGKPLDNDGDLDALFTYEPATK